MGAKPKVLMMRL